MNVLSWNCRGLGNPRAIQFLMGLVGQKKPCFVFLCETRCNNVRVEVLRKLLGFEGAFAVDS